MDRPKISLRYFLFSAYSAVIIATLIYALFFFQPVNTSLAQHLLPVSGPILMNNVNVIDGTGSDIQTSMNLLIRQGRIQTISALPIGIPPDATVIDAEGRYLIPGLWDMHVHWYDGRFLPLFIANGVTGVRQMWGMDVHYRWRNKENDPEFIGPKQVIASVILDGEPKAWPNSIAVTKPEHCENNCVSRIYQWKNATRSCKKSCAKTTMAKKPKHYSTF